MIAFPTGAQILQETKHAYPPATKFHLRYLIIFTYYSKDLGSTSTTQLPNFKKLRVTT